MNYNTIGQLIQRRRTHLSLNQADLSEMSGITTKTIYAIENGKANPSLSTLNKILDVLGLEMNICIKKITE